MAKTKTATKKEKIISGRIVLDETADIVDVIYVNIVNSVT
jgi:hypothetical protein